jgi:acyl carrier protein
MMADPAPGGALSADSVAQKVRMVVAKSLDIDPERVQLSASLVDELGAQSLDMLDMAFMLEREFRISFPRTDILERAVAHFGEETLVRDGVVTAFGLRLLRRGMPELDATRLQPGLPAADVVRMVTVQTFVRIVLRLLEAKQQFPRECPVCRVAAEESDVMPELVCPMCGAVRPFPSGDETLLQDLIALADGLEA